MTDSTLDNVVAIYGSYDKVPGLADLNSKGEYARDLILVDRKKIIDGWATE